MAWEKVADSPNGSERSGFCGSGSLLYLHNASVNEFHSYDPATDVWTPLTTPPGGPYGQLFSLAGGQLILLPWNVFFPTVQMYDIATDTWTTKTPCPNHSNRSVWTTDGTLIYGALIDSSQPIYGDTGITIIVVYDPVADTWDTTSMATPPDYAGNNAAGLGWGSLHWVPATASSHASLVYANGWWDQDWPAGETWILDLVDQVWLPGTPEDLPREDQAFGSFGIAGLMEYAIVAGGDGGDAVNGSFNETSSVQVYDLINDVWNSLDDLPVALDFPSLTVWNGYVWIIGGYGDTSVVTAPAPFSGDQTALYRMPYSALPNGGVLAQPAPDVPPTTQLQVEDTTIDTPGFITVSVSNVTAGGLVSFRLDVDDSSHEIDTATVDDSGNLVHHDVLVSDHLVNASTHTLYAHNVDTGSDDGTFLVSNDQPGEDFMADPVPPILIVRTGVQRWYFQDPTGQTPDHFIFPRNPHTYSTPYADKVIGYDFTTGGPENGQMITMEGKPKPVSWTFEGVLLTKAEENQFAYWFKRSYRIYIVDHENRAYLTYITHFEVTPKHSVNHPEKRDYKMTATVYGYPVQL